MAQRIVKEPLSFLDLPLEVRTMVYDFYTQDSKIRLDYRTIDLNWAKKPFSPLELSTTKKMNALPATCTTIRDEVMPTLAKNTSLNILDTSRREDPLRSVAPFFLSHVRSIVIDLPAFPHINRKLLPSLKHVTVALRSEAIDTLSGTLHVLHCKNCGGADEFLRASVSDLLDWEWMKDQILYLSVKDNWTVLFKMIWECYDPFDSALEVEYDMKSDKYLTAKMIIDGNVYNAEDLTHTNAVLEMHDLELV